MGQIIEMEKNGNISDIAYTTAQEAADAALLTDAQTGALWLTAIHGIAKMTDDEFEEFLDEVVTNFRLFRGMSEEEIHVLEMIINNSFDEPENEEEAEAMVEGLVKLCERMGLDVEDLEGLFDV